MSSSAHESGLPTFENHSTVLLVGLDLATKAVVTTALASEGYGSIGVKSADAAADVLRSGAASLVLCGFDPCPADPLEGLDQLFSAQPGVAIIVLAADGDMSIARKALRRGAIAYLHSPLKPFEFLTQLYGARLRQNSRSPSLQTTNPDLRSPFKAPYLVTEHLALACLARDAETGTHVARVGRYSALVARSMGFSAKQAEFIATAATTHDVGKLGIPDAILNKPSALTPDEFETMKTHTTIGGAILAGTEVPILKLAERIALEHHERWNGAGYPSGLIGDQSILEARIVAIADVYDALAHERVYKKAWPESRVLAFFQEQRGKQFDPRVVDAFMAVLPQVQRTRRELSEVPNTRHTHAA